MNSDLNKSARFGEQASGDGEENHRNSLCDRTMIIEFSNNLDQLIQSQMKQLQSPSAELVVNTETNKTQLSPRHVYNNSMKLCDKVLSFRKSCLTYAEDSLSPQQRFRFRELLTKLEKNAESLRSNSESDLNHIYSELQSNIKDIVTVVQK